MSIATGEIGRPRRGRLYIVIGAILAVLAFATAAGLASLPLLRTNTAGTQVGVAKNNINARTKIQASDLELTAVNPAPPQAFFQLKDLVGNAPRVVIPARPPVTAN